MDQTVSVSKGCFVFNSSSSKKKTGAHKCVESQFQGNLWHKSYTTLRNSAETKLQHVYDNVYTEVLKDLVQFVEKSHDKSSQTIPIAALLTGINMPDHAILFESLSSLLHERVTPHVATLHARDCTTIRASVEQIVSQLMNQNNSDEDSDDGTDVVKKQQCNFIALEAWYRELVSKDSPSKVNRSTVNGDSVSPSKMLRSSNSDELKSPSKMTRSSNYNESKSSSKPSPKRTNIDELQSPSLSNGACKYALQEGVVTSSCNSLKRSVPLENIDGDSDSKESRPIIVVVIPEFEGFSNKVLQNLLTIASFQMSALPITFVFGVATSVQALQRGLSYGVSSKISIEVFHSQKSITFLDHVLEQILLNDSSPFHLGGKTFRLFCEVFLFYDFSVEGFIQHLKFCMMEHYYGRNINSLCCTLEELDSNIAALSHSDLAELRNVPSFQKYTESCSVKEMELLKSNDKHLKKEVRTLVHQLYKHSSCFYSMLRVVHILFSTLPNAPLGQQIRQIYEKAISGRIYETKEYKECMKLLGFQSRDELLEKLREIIKMLTEANSTIDNLPFTETINSLQLVNKQLKSAGMNHVRSPSKSPSKSPVKSPKKNTGLSLTDSAGKRIGRTQFLQNVLVSGKTDHPLSDYERARQALVDCLSTCLPPFLAPLTGLPLHELVLFDDVQLVKSHLIGAPRAAVHMALNNPHYYLQCKCCALPSTSAILGSLPDLCIAYKLHLECGKLINLYDWLQSFSAIVSPQTTNDDADDRQVCPEIQARFASAVAELQFLGFIKSSKKKTDHVTRLTFNPK